MKLEERLNVTLWDDEGVAFGNGETIPDGDGVVGFGDDPVGGERAERAVGIHASSLRYRSAENQKKKWCIVKIRPGPLVSKHKKSPAGVIASGALVVFTLKAYTL